MAGRVQVHIRIDDYTLEELVALRAKIENFLASEADAKLIQFNYTENIQDSSGGN